MVSIAGCNQHMSAGAAQLRRTIPISCKASLTLSEVNDLYREILGAKTACTDIGRDCQSWQHF